MKYFLILLLLPLSGICQTSFYVKDDGNDANTGTSDLQAWRTTAKVNSYSFAANSTILFKRGDTITGGIVVKRSNLTFGAYGTGAKPVISGFTTVSGWVSVGINLWEAAVTNVKADVNLVLRNNAIQQVGRYPNTDDANGGYLTMTASSATSVTGPALSSARNWTGAEIAIRCNRWTIDRKTVTSHSAGTVTFSALDVRPRENFGYFFQRDPRTLDKDGEWWYDASNSKLRVYSIISPTAYNYQISTVDTLLGNNLYYNNITVTDIDFIGAGKKAVWMYSGANHNISNVGVKFSGAEGISTSASFNVAVNNCTTNNCLASGIRLFNNDADPIKLSVTNCVVDSTALIAGMELANVVQNGSNGICVRGNKNTIHYNRITNSGYCGIEWQGNDVSIKYNVVIRFCSVRDDGGGIYTIEGPGKILPARTNRKVVSNIVMYAIGANAGAGIGADIERGTSARGLYGDEGTRFVTYDSNTVAYCIGTGFHGNNNASLIITNNVFYDCKGGYSLQKLEHGNPVRNMVIKNNIIYPYLFEYGNLAIDKPFSITFTTDIAALGMIDSNYYSLKPSDRSLFKVVTDSVRTFYDSATYSMSFLKNYQEQNSVEAEAGGSLYWNETASVNTVDFTGFRMRDLKGNVFSNSYTLPRFSSVILLPDGAIDPPPVDPPPTDTARRPIRLRMKVII